MFRLSRLIQSAKPLFSQAARCFFKPSSLLFNNFVYFSQAPTHKIFQLIQQENLSKNIDKVVKELESLSEQLRQQALQAILQKIIDGELTPKALLNEKLLTEWKKYPSLYFDASYFRLSQSITKLDMVIDGSDTKMKKVLAKQISQYFVVCFDIIKNMEVEAALPKEVQLLSTFAQYNINNLTRLVDTSDVKEVINKSRESYKLALTKISTLLQKHDQEIKTLQKQINQSEIQAQKNQKTQQLEEIEQSKFDYIEQYSQIVTEMMSIEQSLQEQRKQKLKKGKRKSSRMEEDDQPQFTYSKEALALEPFLNKAIKNYSLVQNKNAQSKFYYNLKKVIFEIISERKIKDLQFSSVSEQEKQNELKKIENEQVKALDQLYIEAVQGLKQISANKMQAQDLSEFIMTILSTQFHRFGDNSETGSIQAVEKQMGEQVQKLASFIKEESLRKKTLVLVIQSVKQNFGVMIDSYVEKLPRNIRNQRKNRKQSEE